MPDVVVDQEGVLKLLKDIKVNKAVSPDGIPNKALKLAADEIAPVITFIFQQSLDESYLPEDWRRADITPIFKKGSKAEPSNYLPVSLTTVLCKHLEHMIDSQMMSHFDSHGVLPDCQHAFRKMRSCETQLITTLHDPATNHNKSITTDIAVLDFSKAFDVVPHQHLLLKLDYYGIRNKTLDWIRAFLTQRQQRVVVNGKKSDWDLHVVVSGVPQGTVSGPHDFIAFINDIAQDITLCIRLFTDDSIIYRSVQEKKDEQKFQEDLDRLINWAELWGMKFNAAKCKVMCISRKRSPGKPSYVMLGETLEEVTSTQYLGVYIQNSLKWDLQTQHAAGKATRALNFLMRNFHNCTKKIKEKLYSTLVKPHLQYASAAWNPGTKKNKELLEKVQSRAARYVVGDFQKTSSVTGMLKELNWETVEESRIKSRIRTLHKIITNQLAIDGQKYFKDKPQRKRRGHDRQLVLHETPYSTVMKDSFFAEAVECWNSLQPEELPNDDKNLQTSEALPNDDKNLPTGEALPNDDENLPTGEALSNDDKNLTTGDARLRH